MVNHLYAMLFIPKTWKEVVKMMDEEKERMRAVKKKV